MAGQLPDERDTPAAPSGETEPELYALSREAGGYRLTRRSLLRAAAAVSASAAVTGCSARDEASGADLQRYGGGRVLMDAATACPYRAHAEAVIGLALTPDSQLLASASSDGSIKLWTLPGGDLQLRLNAQSPLSALAASPDGRQLVAACQKSAELRFWDLPDGLAAGPPLAVPQPGRPLAWSAHGALLATSSGPVVQLWSVRDHKLLGELRQHTDPVTSLSFSPNGKVLACASDDRTISLWSVPSRTLLRVVAGHTKPVTSVCFAGRSRIVSAGGDGTVRLWSMDGNAISTLANGASANAIVAASQRRQRLAASSGNGIRLWGLGEDTAARSLDLHAAPVSCLAFTADGHYLVSGDTRGGVILWELGRKRRCWALWDIKVDPQVGVRWCRVLVPGASTPQCACDMVWAGHGTTLQHQQCVCNTVALNGGPGARPPSLVAPPLAPAKPGRCWLHETCTLHGHCTCDVTGGSGYGGGGGGGGGGYGGHYWRPN